MLNCSIFLYNPTMIESAHYHFEPACVVIDLPHQQSGGIVVGKVRS